VTTGRRTAGVGGAAGEIVGISGHDLDIREFSLRTTPSICGASAWLRASAPLSVTSSTSTRTRCPMRAASRRALMSAARSMKRA